MTVEALINELGLKIYNAGDLSREITGCYAGDLLSWVMGRAPAGCVWVTIMTNVNITAVAHLADTACVLLAENAEPDLVAKERAGQQKTNLLGSPDDTYTLCVKISRFLESL